MSLVIVLFLFDETAFEQVVRPAIADFVPGRRTGSAMDLLRRAAGAGHPGSAASRMKAGYDRIAAELEADGQGRRRDPGGPSLHELFSGRAHPALDDARESARFLLEELEESSFSPKTSAHLVWSATRRLVDNYCIPWSRFKEPVFRMTGSAGESYLVEHGEEPGELLLGGNSLELAKNWDIQVLSPAEARAWAAKLRAWGPPDGKWERADHERLLVLFDEGSKEHGLRLAVTAD